MIELIDYCGSDASVANAARVSFSSFENWNTVPEGYTEERAHKLINYLAGHKHMTPFRHQYITLKCKAPIFIARQLGKHQVGLSWNEVSRRYVKGQVEFHTPETWREAPDGSIKQGSAGTHPESGRFADSYTKVVAACTTLYTIMLEEGVAPEQARMVLPQSMLTEWVWSGSLLAFAHIYNERSAPGAQVECQEFAKELNAIIYELFPVSWGALTK